MPNEAANDPNYVWFMENLSELVKKFDNRFVVIKDKTIIGDYPALKIAYVETVKTERPGTFLIQLCSFDLSSITAVFHSRVSFV